MSELSSALGNAGGKHVVTVKGKTYSIGLIDKGTQAEFEKAVYRKARERIKSIKDLLDADEYAEMMDRAEKSYVDGHFGMLGKRGAEVFSTPGGSAIMLSIMMGTTEEETMQLLLDSEQELTIVFRSILKESFPTTNFATAFESIDKKDNKPTVVHRGDGSGRMMDNPRATIDPKDGAETIPCVSG